MWEWLYLDGFHHESSVLQGVRCELLLEGDQVVVGNKIETRHLRSEASVLHDMADDGHMFVSQMSFRNVGTKKNSLTAMNAH